MPPQPKQRVKARREMRRHQIVFKSSLLTDTEMIDHIKRRAALPRKRGNILPESYEIALLAARQSGITGKERKELFNLLTVQRALEQNIEQYDRTADYEKREKAKTLLKKINERLQKKPHYEKFDEQLSRIGRLLPNANWVRNLQKINMKLSMFNSSELADHIAQLIRKRYPHEMNFAKLRERTMLKAAIYAMNYIRLEPDLHKLVYQFAKDEAKIKKEMEKPNSAGSHATLARRLAENAKGLRTLLDTNYEPYARVSIYLADAVIELLQTKYRVNK